MVRATPLLLAAFVVAVPLCAQDAPAPPIVKTQLRGLETAAHQIARGGWADELTRLISAMKTLGYGDADADKLLAACRKELPKDKDIRTPLPPVAKSLRTTADQLAKLVPNAPESAPLANAILAIDDTVVPLHEMLGRRKTDTGWLSEADGKAAARRGEIMAALAKARRLAPEVTVSETTDPIYDDIHKSKCTTVSARGLTLRGRWPAPKLARVLVEALRAAAVSDYLIGGTLEMPIVNHEFLILDAEKDYNAAVDIAARNKWLTPKDAEMSRKLAGFYLEKSGEGISVVAHQKTEAHAEASLLFALSRSLKCSGLCPPLYAGHMNWVCLSYLGTPMPGVAIEDLKTKERRTGGRQPGDIERMLRISEGGITGSRSWLAWLVKEGRDPSFGNSIVDQVGKIEGDDRIKCTFVVEYLQERDELNALADRTTGGLRSEFETAWGSIASFEDRWRASILGARPSIAAAIDPPKPRALSKSESEVIAQLNQLRIKCFKGSICGDVEVNGIGSLPSELVDPYLEVTLDDLLSKGARSHAVYLAKHADQLAAWPDAHEEWPDRDGFSPEGGWAGGHSVIAPGVATATEALDGWLGTYYHRLPLIHPGLLKIGWGLEKNIAVLDSGSIARPLPGPWHVVWPYDGMQNVPTRFAPELPNPVPGADQSRFGYPVTLQIGDHADETAPPTVTVELREGTAAGAAVECHVSTPEAPSYPDLPTPNAWCLIPKAPLKGGTSYFAVARWSSGRKIAWSFKTGK